MIIVTFGLTIWAVYLKAPNWSRPRRRRASQPVEGPVYFLGLQEMLVYFDPWMAGRRAAHHDYRGFGRHALH